MTFVLAFGGFFGGKGSDGLGDWVVVLVDCAVFERQCACGATRDWRETGSPAATTCFFCFAMRVVLAPAALHIVGYHNIHMVGALHAAPAQAPPPQNNAPTALHRVGGETMAPTRGAYIFFLFCHAGGFGACGATYCWWLLMGKQCACGATYCWLTR